MKLIDFVEEDLSFELELEDGKYTIVYHPGKHFYALRYGEEWRDLTGDNLTFLLCLGAIKGLPKGAT
jgi:hypothetical protein